MPGCAWTTTRPFTTALDDWVLLQAQAAPREPTDTESAYERARLRDVSATRRPRAEVLHYSPANDEELAGVQVARNPAVAGELAQHNGVPVVWVTEVPVGGAAGEAGLRPGQMIAMINDMALPGARVRNRDNDDDRNRDYWLDPIDTVAGLAAAVAKAAAN